MSVSPPRSKGPHLNALRAFESAGRLKSFVAAAEELNVTPGAISQHIKSLESWAEGQLFVRSTRGVALSELGEALLPEFTQAFDLLNEAVQSLRSKSAPSSIKIATLPSIAQLWLSEKLGHLRAIAPEISVSVEAVERAPNLARDPFDVTLFFQDHAPDPGEIALFQDRIFPVCTPRLAERLARPGDLARESLLHDSTWRNDWDFWLSSLPQPPRLATRGPTYSLFSVALEEACNGAGVLMAHEALVAARLQAGDLVAPFAHKVTLQRWLVMRMASRFRANPAAKLLQTAMSQPR